MISCRLSNFNNGLELFLDKLYTEKNLSKATISSYKADIEKFIIFLENNKQNTLTCSDTIISKWVVFLNKSNYKDSSLIRKLSVIKQFFQFLFLENYRKDDPSVKIIIPKKTFSLPKVLDEKDLNIIFQYLYDNKKSFKNYQVLVLTELLYATGLRVSELVSLKVSAITEKFDHIYVKGKGNKERVLPLSNLVQKMLKNYLNNPNFIKFKKNIKGDMWIFPSRKKNISRQSYFLKLKNVALKAGLDASIISPHTIRHAFASHMLKNGADLKVIQYFLGHEDISTVQIYTHVNLKETVKAIEKHPISKALPKS